MVFSLTTKAQTVISWGAATGTPFTRTGFYTGGSVDLTQSATGNNIFNFTPVNYTNLNGAVGSQGIAMNGPGTSVPSRSLIFTFSTPVIINELNIADIDLGGFWHDAFTFSGVTFTSVTGANCNFTTTSATPTTDVGASAEWARWSTSTTPVTSFTINFATTGGLTNAVLNYSMTVTAATCNAGTTAPTLSATTKANVCPATTVELTTITASNLPSGTTLTWHTATPATTANKIATPSAVAAGTYYAAFFDATNNCYSGTSGDGSATAVVTATVTACCTAGTAVPSLSATTISNVCPTATVNLTSITASNLPGGTTLTWHTATPATTANKIATPSAVTAGTYYAAFFDATNNCYSGTSGNGSATTVVTATTTTCAALTANNPTTQTVPGGQAYTGNAGTELAPTGGTGPYTYSNGSSDPACINPGGATALPPASNLTVTNSTTGAYTYTAPTASGTYFFCIKVCDSTSPTPNCVVKTYTVVVPCAAGNTPPVLIKN